MDSDKDDNLDNKNAIAGSDEEFTSFTQHDLGLLGKFQLEDISLKRDELEFRMLEENHAYDFSKDFLNKQFEYKKFEGESKNKIIKLTIYSSLIVIIIFICFCIFSVMYGKEQLAESIIKYVLPLAIGGIGGYSFGYGRGKTKADAKRDFE